MDNKFFEKPILNSPYGYPLRHWELDSSGQPTQQIIEHRRDAKFISPIPKPKKRKGVAQQSDLGFEDDAGLSTEGQRYDHTATINAARIEIDKWRALPNPIDWRVTPETARLLQHWRHHKFSSTRPFFAKLRPQRPPFGSLKLRPKLVRQGHAFSITLLMQTGTPILN